MDNALNPVNHANIQAIYSSPLAYYAYTMAVLGNFDFLHGPHADRSEHIRLQLSHRITTIKLINAAITEMTGPPPDELIGAVLVLAAADPENVIDHSLRPISRYRSPLARAQWLDVYGAQSLVPSHAMALVRLVQLKGGWKEFKTLGLAGICEL